MAELLRLHVPKTGDGRRWTVGVAVSSRCARAAAALVAAAGRGLDCQVDVAGAITAEIPRETAVLFSPASGKGSLPVGALVTLRAELAEHEASLIESLLGGVSVAPSRVLAVGVHDPGSWNRSQNGPYDYLGLCDGVRLAESSGLNVIDAFPARDLVHGGQGGPILALPEWILFFSLAGYEYFPEERLAYQEKQMSNAAQLLGIKPVDDIAGVTAEKMLNILKNPSKDPYWKLRHKGNFQDIFFLTTMDKTAKDIAISCFKPR